MICIDIDGTLLKFYETLKEHFGIEIAPNDFTKFHWRINSHCPHCGETCIYPTPEEFYAKAELQPWVNNLCNLMETSSQDDLWFLTKDYGRLKYDALIKFGLDLERFLFNEIKYKSLLCENPRDLLIDDNAAECDAWRKAGGIAYHFNLAQDDPFGRFLKWWRLGNDTLPRLQATLCERIFSGNSASQAFL